MDFFSYLQIFGIPAAVTAATIFIFSKRDKKADNLKSHLKEKMEFLGSVLFQLDRMRFMHEVIQQDGQGYRDEEHPNAERYAYSSSEGEAIFKNINELLQKNYALFGQNLMKNWVDIRTNWYNPSVIEKVPKFRKDLVKEYNDTVDRYNKLTLN